MDTSLSLISNYGQVLYIWNDRLLYIGNLPPNTMHRFSVDTLSINLTAPFIISNDYGSTWAHCRSVLWPANCLHQSIYYDSIMAMYAIEPITHDGKIIQTKMHLSMSNYFIHIKDENYIIKKLSDIYMYRPEADQALKLANEIITHGCNKNLIGKIKESDKRIIKISEIIKEDYSKNHKIEEFASLVHLSTSRLGHMFKEETNTTISQYRLWCRFKEAMSLSAKYNLSKAAIMAGFTDCAHFNRTFKTFTGMSPSSVLKKLNNLQIIVSN